MPYTPAQISRPGLALKCRTLLPLLVAFSGCAAPPSAVPVKPANQCLSSQTRDGLTIAAHPIFKNADSREFFGTTLADDQLLAVLVVVDNQSPTASFILDQKECRLMHSDGSAGPVPARDLLGGTPKNPGEGRLARYALMANQFCPVAILPGEKAQGFIYFPWPEASQKNPRDLGIRVVVRESPENTPHQLELSIKRVDLK